MQKPTFKQVISKMDGRRLLISFLRHGLSILIICSVLELWPQWKQTILGEAPPLKVWIHQVLSEMNWTFYFIFTTGYSFLSHYGWAENELKKEQAIADWEKLTAP